MKEFIRMSAKGKAGRVDVYDEIGFWGTRAATFAREWKELESSSERIEVHVASPGGNPFDALTIFNVMQQSKVPVDTYIDGLAASAASIIAMGGRKSYMADNALLMLHNPYMLTIGDKDEHEASIRMLEATTDAIVTAYANKSGKTREEIMEIMDAETWYDAQSAKKEGFVDKVVKAVPMAAKFDVAAYGYTVPESFQDRLKVKEPERPAQTQEVITMSETNKPEAPKPASIAEIKAACDGCDDSFVLSQIEASATMDRVQAAWTKVLAKRVADAEAKAVELEKKNTELAAKQPAPGNDPVGDGKSSGTSKAESGDVLAQFDEACAIHMKAGKSKQQAIRAVAIENKELHAAYIRAYNQNVGRAV